MNLVKFWGLKETDIVAKTEAKVRHVEESISDIVAKIQKLQLS